MLFNNRLFAKISHDLLLMMRYRNQHNTLDYHSRAVGCPHDDATGDVWDETESCSREPIESTRS